MLNAVYYARRVPCGRLCGDRSGYTPYDDDGSSSSTWLRDQWAMANLGIPYDQYYRGIGAAVGSYDPTAKPYINYGHTWVSTDANGNDVVNQRVRPNPNYYESEADYWAKNGGGQDCCDCTKQENRYYLL